HRENRVARWPRGRAAGERRHGARAPRRARGDRPVVASAEDSVTRMQRTPAMRIPRNAGLGVLIVVALVLVWRIVASGSAAFVAGTSSADPNRWKAPLDVSAPEAQWRARLAR